jgi:hypothetical protein
MIMQFHVFRTTLMVSGVLLVAACSSSNKTSDVAINEPEPQTESVPQDGPWKARNITEALSDRTFAYTDGGRNGQVTYNSDYTFSYREEGKGEGTGIWQPSDEQLCEAFDPTSFLPRGSPSRCHPFSSIDNTFTVGSKRLRPA